MNIYQKKAVLQSVINQFMNNKNNYDFIDIGILKVLLSIDNELNNLEKEKINELIEPIK